MGSTRDAQHSRIRTRHLLTAVVAAGFSSLLVSACLTPEFNKRTSDANANGGADPGPAHCSNRQTDSDETDVDCGGLDCSPCALGKGCSVPGDCENATCTAGRCQAASCTDAEKNDTETDVDCGGECPPCADDKRCTDGTDCESALCSGGTCAAATCEDRIKNGSESGIDCGGECSPCDSGQPCLVNSDCAQPPDGKASATCQDGECALLCPAGTGDCNRMAADGCEAQLNTDLGNCGACGDTCQPTNAAAAKCQAGACLIDFENGGCQDGYSDCNGSPGDGCEVDTSSDTSHCGSCNAACSENNGTPSCSGGTCIIDCADDYHDCDADARGNGCEANLATSTLDCGSCGNVCTPNPGESASCDITSSPPCVSIACDAPSDCGGAQPCGACGADQLCNDQLDSTSNCGGCGIQCSASNGTTACAPSGGNFTCTIAECDDSPGQTWEDCDGQYANGCETNVDVSVTHCGGCSGHGGENCAALLANPSLGIASIGCTAGECEITGCNGNTADCDNDASNGCEPLATVSNCLSCGDVCGASTPFCTASGCRDHLLISLVDEDNTLSGVANSHQLSLTHNLKTARSSSSRRTIVALVGYRGNNVDLPPTVTYAGKPMTPGSVQYSGNQAWSGIYYILDAQLPATSGDKAFVVTGDTNNTVGLSARLLELLNVDQSSPVGSSPSQDGQQGCNNSQSANGLAPDSWVLSNMTIWADVTVSGTGSQTAFSTLKGGGASSAGGYEADVSDSTHAWSCSSPQNWAHVMLALQPEGSD